MVTYLALYQKQSTSICNQIISYGLLTRLRISKRTCHCMTNAPLILSDSQHVRRRADTSSTPRNTYGAGAHSALYTGTVDDFEPIPRPRKNRATKRFTQEFATPSQIEATAAMKQLMKIVPRRPKYRLRGSVSQHPKTAQARYGAPTTRPVRLSISCVENRSLVMLNLAR